CFITAALADTALRASLFPCNNHTITAGILGFVEDFICTLAGFLETLIRVYKRYTQAQGDVQRFTVLFKYMFGNRFSNSFSQDFCSVFICFGTQENKLFTTPASKIVAAPDNLFHQIANAGNNPVADVVTATVIDPFEMVDIDQNYTERAFCLRIGK